MKIYIILILIVSVSYKSYSQSDSIRHYINMQPLFRMIDSVARNLEQQGKSVYLVFYSSGHNRHSGIILWKNEEKHHGTYFQKADGSDFKKNNLAQRKIKSILNSRLLSDSCDLCGLTNVDEKDKIDHEYIMYLNLNVNSKCKEMYFTNSAYLAYGKENCIYDVREIVAGKISWPGKVTVNR